MDYNTHMPAIEMGPFDPQHHFKLELLDLGPAGEIPIDRLIFELEAMILLPLLEYVEVFTYKYTQLLAEIQSNPNAQLATLGYDKYGQLQIKFT